MTWLTYSPEAVPTKWVDNILDFTVGNIIWLTQQRFDWLINLDKDREAIALAQTIHASRKSGFRMNDYGKCVPFGEDAARHKWLTGVWDDVNRGNTLNYMEEIFPMCDYRFSGEEYILETGESSDVPLPRSTKVIGLNTGCGARWLTRLWPEAYWIELAKSLGQRGYETILLGGPQEEERNRRISEATGARCLTTHTLRAFFTVVNECDVIVSQVTMAMHVAIALRKHLVLMNNIFNRHEFFLYGRGEIVEPDLDCLGCFKQQFDDRCKSSNCMEMIAVGDVVQAVERGADAGVSR